MKQKRRSSDLERKPDDLHFQSEYAECNASVEYCQFVIEHGAGKAVLLFSCIRSTLNSADHGFRSRESRSVASSSIQRQTIPILYNQFRFIDEGGNNGES
jgi:hypothetical protein